MATVPGVESFEGEHGGEDVAALSTDYQPLS